MFVSGTLREAVKAALTNGTTRYRIAKATGLDHSALSRFLAEGRDVRLSTVDRLADFVGLELTAKKGRTTPE